MSDGQQLVLESMHRPGHVIVQDPQVSSLQPHLPGHVADPWISLLPVPEMIAFANIVVLLNSCNSAWEQPVMLCTDFMT